jgi:hypothetical protein
MFRNTYVQHCEFSCRTFAKNSERQRPIMRYEIFYINKAMQIPLHQGEQHLVTIFWGESNIHQLAASRGYRGYLSDT